MKNIKNFKTFSINEDRQTTGLFFNHILDGEDATEENAYDHARGLDWMEVESSEQSYPYLNYVDTVNGVGIYHNFGHDAYYFTDETNEDNVNEMIDTSTLNDAQRIALTDFVESNTELYDDADFSYIADEIGVPLEDLLAHKADSLLVKKSTEETEETVTTDTDTTEDDYSEDNSYKEQIQSDIIDNEDVDSSNLTIKIEELAEEIYMNSFVDSSFEDLHSKLIELHKEMTFNPTQLDMKFESTIKKFKDFI